MKKITLISLLIVVLIVASVALTACANTQYAGTYEMVDVSGTLTTNGQTTTLNKSMYDYYRIILKPNGKAVVESKAAGSIAVSIDSKWEYEDGKINLITTTSGVKVVETMTINGDTITYSATQSAQGITIDFSIVLKKQ